MALSLSKNLPTNGSFKVCYITWNMANHKPTKKDIEAIINAQDVEVDLIIISAQEETREQKKSLGSLIQNTLGTPNLTQLHYGAFNTFTTGRGRLSQSFITNHPITVSNSHKIQEAATQFKFKNKGGIATNVVVSDKDKEKVFTFQSAGMHLDSHLPSARIRETSTLMEKIEIQVTTYDDLTKKATTPIFLGGDLNYRNRLNNEGESIDPKDDKDQLMRHFDLHGFSEAGKSGSNICTYSGKDTHKKGASSLPSPQADVEDTITRSSDQKYLTRIGGTHTRESTYHAAQKDNKRSSETRGGKLDRVLYRGQVVDHDPNEENIIQMPKYDKQKKVAGFTENGERTSDHKPVVTLFTITQCNDEQTAFKHTKHFVKNRINEIKMNFNADQQAQLNALEGNIENLRMDDKHSKTTLVTIYKLYETFKKQALQFEYHRMIALEIQAKALALKNKKGVFGFLKRLFSKQSPDEMKKDAANIDVRNYLMMTNAKERLFSGLDDVTISPLLKEQIQESEKDDESNPSILIENTSAIDLSPLDIGDRTPTTRSPTAATPTPGDRTPTTRSPAAATFTQKKQVLNEENTISAAVITH